VPYAGRPWMGSRPRRSSKTQAGDSTIFTRRDFATTLRDGRRVVGRHDGKDWSVRLYSPGQPARLVGYGVAATRLAALEDAGVSAELAGEVLGRIGI
jgi:hypothetical protein